MAPSDIQIFSQFYDIGTTQKFITAVFTILQHRSPWWKFLYEKNLV